MDKPLIIRAGQVVSPQEVEQILLSHPGVAEACVVGVPDQFWDEIVAAAVRLSAPLPAAAADLTAYCRDRLAPGKVPVRWLFTGALPRTGSGRLCRATLRTQLTVVSHLDGAPWSAEMPAVARQRPSLEDIRIPHQGRWSGTLEDLDHL
jgi:fatty-acyl-CoA synthase